jgi:hypothetical protein
MRAAGRGSDRRVDMRAEITNRQLRGFGLMWAAIAAGMGAWPQIRGHGDATRWLLVGGACLFLVALAAPGSLVWGYRAWMAVGHVLGWINTRIILGAIFYLAVVPIGVARSWLGKDPMGRRFESSVASYRVPRKPRTPSHLMKQY